MDASDCQASAARAAYEETPAPSTGAKQPSQRWDTVLSRTMSTLVEQRVQSRSGAEAAEVPEVVQAMAVLDDAGHIKLDFEGEDDEIDLSTIRAQARELEAAAAAERAQTQTPTDSGYVPAMSVSIIIVGTRGDVQPFIAIAKRLQAYGHRVRLATHAVYREFVVSHDVEFYPLGGDPKELAAYMVKTGGHLIPTKLETIQKDVPRNLQMIDEILHSTWPAVSAPDPDGGGPGVPGRSFRANAVIANPVSYGHTHVAERLGVPLHIMFPQPWVPTVQFPHPLSNLPYTWEPKMRNYMSYKLVDLLMWQGVEGIVNEFRTETLGLSKIRKGDGGRDMLLDLGIPHAFMWSPQLVPKPADWGPIYDVIGTVTLQETGSSYSPTPELEAFLGDDGGPIFVGFGSMILAEPQRVTKMIIDAAAQANVRVLIQSSWSDMAGDMAVPDNVFFLGNCPHDWLMPRVSAVVHHGGAGTTAAGLLAGKPTFIVPFFGDQPFWGRAVVVAGVGVEPCPIAKLSTERLRAAFEGLVDPELRLRAMALRDLMRREDGAGEAVQSFYRNLPLAHMACDLDCGRAASMWSQRLRLKLCAMCEFVVTCRPENAPNDVVEYHVVNYSARGPSTMLSGAVAGVGAFFHELGSGVRDLFVEPANGYREGGAAGAVVGIVKGVGGFLISPLQGAVVFADHVATGRENKRRGKARSKLASVLIENDHLKAFLGIKKVPEAHTAMMHPSELVSVDHKSSERQVAVRLTRFEKKRLELAIRQLVEQRQRLKGKAGGESTPNRYRSTSEGGAVTVGEGEFSVVHRIHVRPAGIATSPRSSSVPAMTILMISPGDWSESVQQFVAIGRQLRVDGHRVRIAAAPELREKIVSHGLEFYPLGGRPGTLADFQRYLHASTTKISKHRSKLAQLAHSKLQGRLSSVPIRSELRALVFSLWPACVEADPLVPHVAFRADVIISEPLVFGQTIVAERLGVPLHCMSAAPSTPTAAFPHPLVAHPKLQKPSSQAKLNAVSYKVLDNVASNVLHKLLDEFRDSLGLEGKGPKPDALAKWKIPHTYLWSPQLLPKPTDWGQEITVAGYVELHDTERMDERMQLRVDAIRAFAAADSKPLVYFGISSAEQSPRSLLYAMEAAARAAQIRVILQMPDAASAKFDWKNNDLLEIGPDVPVKQVLPLVAAAVHSGDLSIASACLALAKPAYVIPHTATQRLWGQALALQGVGVGPLEAGATPSASALEHALRKLLDPVLADAASHLAAAVSSFRAVEIAVTSFYANLPTAGMRCDLDPSRLARVYDPMTDLKLSYEAHFMMRELLECDYECLKYKPLQYSRRHVELAFADVVEKQRSRAESLRLRSVSEGQMPSLPEWSATDPGRHNTPVGDDGLSNSDCIERPMLKRRRYHALLARTKSFAAHVVEVPDFWATIEEQRASEAQIHAAYERVVRGRPTYPAKEKHHHKKRSTRGR